MRRTAPLLIVLLAIVVHLGVLGGGFVHDDRPQILTNPLVSGLATVPALWSTGVWAGAGSGSSFYRPVMMTSFAFDGALFGRHPFAMHGMQLLLFAALVGACVSWVSRCEPERSVALAAGAVLAVHPVNVEAVAWLSARCEILAALFGILCLDQRTRRATLGARSFVPGLAEGLFFFLAIASKESAVALLLPLAAIDRVQRGSWSPAAFATRWAPLALALALYALLRTRALGSLAGGLLGATVPALAIGALGQGALRLVWPHPLSITPPAPDAIEFGIGAAIVLVGGGAFLAIWRRPAPWLVPLSILLAFLGVAASGAARIGEMADRYLLLPSLAVGWLAARALFAMPRRTTRVLAPTGALVLAGFAVLSWQHVPVYASNLRLWRHAAERNPASGRAALNVGTALLEQGDAAGARAWLERAALIDPQDRLVTLNRAVLAAELGDVSGARALLRPIADADPAYWPAHLRLGHLALEGGDLDEATKRYEDALRVHPLAAEAWAGLGVAQAQRGRGTAARAALERALALDPNVQNADALRATLRTLGGGNTR